MDQARITAVRALDRVDRGGFSQLTLDAALSKAKLDDREAAFCSALFYGVLERRLTLDHCIAKYARHPLSGTVANILRLAFYQIVYLDSVPPHAAVDEAVEMTKKSGNRAASGMVNGMLRSFLRDNAAIPPVKGGAKRRLSVEYSCDERIVGRFIDWYGEQRARDILAASMGRPPLYIRVNTLKTDAAAVAEHLPEYIDTAAPALLGGSCLSAKGGIAHTVSHKIGFFHIQDYCSQLCALTLEAKPGERILDACAAPGSKSFVLAQEMQNKGEIIACDIQKSRLELINKGAKRLGIGIISTAERDASEYDEALGLFDRALCDVPCSGLGVLRRKPEIKYRGAEGLDSLPPLQYKILENTAKYLKPDGVLVYSTCTLNPDENERVIEGFLARNEGFEPYPFAGEDWHKTFFPDEEGGDGFFISRIRRKA